MFSDFSRFLRLRIMGPQEHCRRDSANLLNQFPGTGEMIQKANAEDDIKLAQAGELQGLQIGSKATNILFGLYARVCTIVTGKVARL